MEAHTARLRDRQRALVYRSSFSPCLLEVTLISLTGNAWAAAGMIRVLGTIQNSRYANALVGQQSDLVGWIQEIHDGMYPYLVRSIRFTSVLIRSTRPSTSSRIPADYSITTRTIRRPFWTRHPRRCSQAPSIACPFYKAYTHISQRPSSRGRVCQRPPMPLRCAILPRAVG